MKRISLYYIVILLLSAPLVRAQDRYMIFFTDKDNSTFDVNRPTEFLSQRALDRRTKNGVDVNELDLPVNQNYVEAIEALGVATYFKTKWMNGVLAQMTDQKATEVQSLEFVASVELVAPGILLSDDPSETPLTNSLSADDTTDDLTANQNQMIGVDVMHEEGNRGEGVLIGVFDNGFRNFKQIPAFNHLLTEDRLVMTRDFSTGAIQVENFGTHGTRVLSVLAAELESYQGVASDANYVLFVTEADNEYRVEEYSWLFAAELADSLGVDIINSSLGYTTFDDPAMSYAPSDMDGATTVISRSAQMAADRGILVVSSAGNLGGFNWQIVAAPADVPDVLSIGAVTSASILASFSSIGPNANNDMKPDVVALGSGTAVVSTSGMVAFQNGTSFSAPLVAGLAAGLLNKNPDLSRVELADAIRGSSSLHDDPNNQYGYGIPNYSLALPLITSIDEVAQADVYIYPNPISAGDLHVVLSDRYATQLQELSLFNLQGPQLLKTNLKPVEGILKVNVDNLIPGLYFLRIKSEQGQVVKKIFIQ